MGTSLPEGLAPLATADPVSSGADDVERLTVAEVPVPMAGGLLDPALNFGAVTGCPPLVQAWATSLRKIEVSGEHFEGGSAYRLLPVGLEPGSLRRGTPESQFAERAGEGSRNS